MLGLFTFPYAAFLSFHHLKREKSRITAIVHKMTMNLFGWASEEVIGVDATSP